MSVALFALVSALIIAMIEFKSRTNISLFFFIANIYIILFYIYPIYVISDDIYVYAFGETIPIDIYDVEKLIFYIFMFYIGMYTMRLILSTSVFKNYTNNKEKYTYRNNIASITCFLFVVLVYSYMFFSGYIQKSSQYRSGAESFSHLKAALILLSIPVGIFVISYYEYNKQKLTATIVGLFVVAIAYSVSGRIVLAYSAMCLVLIYIRRPKLIIAVGVFSLYFFLPYILNLKVLLTSLQRGEGVEGFFLSVDELNLADAIVAQFGYQIVSALQVDKLIELIQYRNFYDYVQGFLFYFQMFGFDFGPSLAYYNTYIVLGVLDSIIPPGYVAMGVVQFGFFGVFIAGVFYASLGFIAVATSGSLGRQSTVALFFLSFLAANTFYYGEMRIIILNFFFPVFVFGCLCYLCRRGNRRRRVTGGDCTSVSGPQD